MGPLHIELCPETGICSLFKNDGTKVDLMPGEVSALRAVLTDSDSVRKIISEADTGFATALTPDELSQLAVELK